MTPQPAARLHFLDGMRGWASLMVLVWHVFIDGYLHWYTNADLVRFILPLNGNVAVSLFFLISGFSLAIPYVTTHDRERLARMAAGRYFRLAIPILVASAFVYAGMISGAVPHEKPYNFLAFEPSLQSLLQFSLWDVFFHFEKESAYILPLWTMHLELYGSLFVFVLLLLFQRLRFRRIIYGFIYAVSAWFMPFLALFTAGIFAADYYKQRPVLSPAGQWLLAPALCIALVLPIFIQQGTSLIALVGMTYFFSALVWIMPCRRFFENRTSQFLGRISFALYLVHGPLLHSYTSHMFMYLRFTLHIDQASVAFIAASTTFVLSILLAIPFTRVDEFGVAASRVIGKKIVSVCKSCAMLRPKRVS